MPVYVDPVWPVVVLAMISAIDGTLSLKPVAFVAKCFRDVGWPRRLWWTMPVIKFAAAVGLVAGIWIPTIGIVTNACLVVYFIVAIAMHIRARDLGRNLFVNAVGMLVICTAVMIWCFLL